MAKEKIKVPSEAEEQKAFCKWLDEQGIKHFATAMGVWLQKPNPVYINSLKTRGFKAGVPDLCILLDNGVTVFIEMKRRKGGTVSQKQKEWAKWLKEHGYPVEVCRGALEAIRFMRSVRGK